MPTSVKDFWSILEGDDPNRYEVAATMLTQDRDGDLVNSINNKESLLLYVLYKREAWALLDVIANHPKFNTLTYAPSDSPGSNAIHLIFSTFNAEVLKKFIAYDDIIFNNKKLSFVEANQNVTAVERRYLRESQKNPNSEAAQRASKQLENVKLMRTMLRDKTIWEAAKRKDPSLLERLEAAGDDVEYPTQDNQTFYSLARMYGATNIFDWHEKRCEASRLRLSQARDALFNKQRELTKVTQKVEDLSLTHHQAKQAVHEKSSQAAKQFVDSLGLQPASNLGMK